LYRVCVVGPFAVIAIGVLVFIADEFAGITQWSLLALLAWVLAIRPMGLVGRATGRELIPVLVETAKVHAAFGLLLALGLVLSRTAA
jgi:1,4-dihydroxy-2-naphthoate octaprenyltransferase